MQLSMTQKRLVESESVWRGCERELTAQLQEARGCEKKLQDEAKNLTLRAQAAQDSAAQSSLQLSEAQGRLAATEAELTRAEASRRDLEFRLSSIQSALTRTLGIGASGRGGRGRSPGGSSTSPGTMSRHHSISPLRSSLSPPKGMNETCSSTNTDLDIYSEAEPEITNHTCLWARSNTHSIRMLSRIFCILSA